MSLNIGRGHLGEQVKANPLEPQEYPNNFIPERQLPRQRENVWGTPAVAGEVVVQPPAVPPAELLPEPAAVSYQA